MKIDCNVNNSISHPPHPRRAVPANLPPGAFFFFRDSIMWFCLALFTTSLFLLSNALHATDDDLFRKIAELRLKSNAHGRFVNEMLVNEPKFHPIEAPMLTSIDNDPIDSEPESLPSLPTVELPSEFETQEFPTQPEQLPQPPQDFTEVESVEEPVAPFPEVVPKTASKEITIKDEVGPTYEELYAPKAPQRRLGYFFGPFIGPVFPDDSAVRTESGKVGYHSDTGITAGLRIGNDFGFTRIEGEYGFLTHNIHSPGKSGDIQLHNLQSRLILEKSLGSRADLRGGIGLGLSFIDKNLGGENYDGLGFSYDFLLGWSFRIMDNWSINMDYRHYLTAAHEHYDRLQGHVVELSTSFDL
jgi:opacity protein-like surface antigen